MNSRMFVFSLALLVPCAALASQKEEGKSRAKKQKQAAAAVVAARRDSFAEMVESRVITQKSFDDADITLTKANQEAQSAKDAHKIADEAQAKAAAEQAKIKAALLANSKALTDKVTVEYPAKIKQLEAEQAQYKKDLDAAKKAAESDSSRVAQSKVAATQNLFDACAEDIEGFNDKIDKGRELLGLNKEQVAEQPKADASKKSSGWFS